MSVELPKGVVTLVFTDIEGHTELFEKLKDAFMPILEAHNELIRGIAASWNGYEVKVEGDAFMLAFSTPSDAIRFAVEAQIALSSHPWEEEVGEIWVRMGMHTGEPLLGLQPDGKPDYFGPAVIRAARIASAGHGGQILVSAATKILAQGVLPEEIEFVDLGAHRLKGLEQAEQIFQVVHPEFPRREFPPLKTLDSVPHNLPVQLTTFVGREKELKELRDLLRQPQTHIVTLLGPGGAGKTRLALQTAAECIDDFPDGVWFVELAEVDNPEQVVPEVVRALKLPVQRERDIRQQLLDFLSSKQILLVLDNFEQITDAAPLVQQLLQSAPKVKCLVTSRITLRIKGEQVFPVPPLKLPELAREGVSAEQLSQYESVALFIERAQAAKPGFEVTSENAPAVAELCYRLEGIPLAIELAAARVRAMMPQEILMRLGQRLDFLSSRDRDVPERQRTLWKSIDWSYGLLSEEEKELFAELSVFHGGFFLEAAEEICTAPDVMDLVFDLHDKSLLHSKEALGQTRYQMLSVVREYAAEKLTEEKQQALRRRHAEYFLKFASSRYKKRRSREEAQAFDELELELDNLRAAMDWAAQSGEDELCARFAVVVGSFLERRGYWQEALEREQTGFQAAQRLGEGGRKLVAQLQHALADIYHDRGELEKAKRLAEESLRLSQALDDKAEIAGLLNLLGLLEHDQGNDEQAKQLIQQALELRKELNLLAGMGVCLHNLGYIAQERGDLAEAQRWYQEALPLREKVGDERGLAETLSNLGVIAEEDGDYDEASRLHLQSLRVRFKLGDRLGVGIDLHNLGEVMMKQGDHAKAVTLLLAAKNLFSELGSPFAQHTGKTLQKLSEELGAERFEELSRQAGAARWQTVVQKVLAA